MNSKARTSVRLAVGMLTFLSAAIVPALPDELTEAAGRYRIEPSSQIGFRVSQVGGGGIVGHFDKFAGLFVLDGNDIGRSTVDFTLFPESVRAGEPRVEKFLRSNAVFDVKEYSEITFRSTAISLTSVKSARIEGVLTARGVSRSTSFDVDLQDRRGDRIAFHVTGDIYRFPYGMGIGIPIYSNLVHFEMMLKGKKL
jgi:polyisoprenoid-binding protein YceI